MTQNCRFHLCSIKREIEELLRDHAGLKEARARRRQDEIADKLSDSKPLAEVINKILKKSPVLSKLFMQGIKVPNPFKTNPAGDSNSFIGNQFPTIFKLETDFARNHPKHAELNRKFRVSYKTDVFNDYFDRDDIPGEFELSIDNQRVEGSRMSLWNGIANLTVSLPKTVEIGDTLKFCSKITDASRAMPFEEEFYVQIMPFTESNGKNGSRRKPPTGDGNKSKKPSYIDLPEVIEVRKEEWDNHGFNEESALKVIDSGEVGYDFFINMDNIYLLSEQKANNKLDPQILGARYKYAHVLMGLALLRSNEKESGQDGDNKNNAWGDSDILAIIGDISKMVSPIMLPMIDTLGDLEIDAD